MDMMNRDRIFDAEDDANQDKIAKTTFQVKDLASADWCARKAREAEERIQERRAYVASRMLKYQEWLDSENERDEKTVAAMAAFLEPWVLREIAGGKKRSVNLPHGIAGFRRTPDRLEVADEGAAVEWARENAPHAIRVRESIDKNEMKANIEATGEVPEGCELVRGTDRFYLDVKEETKNG
jgi:phage host-nuclease inhibitor protein Gam